MNGMSNFMDQGSDNNGDEKIPERMTAILKQLFLLSNTEIQRMKLKPHTDRYGFTYKGCKFRIEASGWPRIFFIRSEPRGLAIDASVQPNNKIHASLSSLYNVFAYKQGEHISWHNVRNVLARANQVQVTNTAHQPKYPHAQLSHIVLATGKRPGFYADLVNYPAILQKACYLFAKNPITEIGTNLRSKIDERMQNALDKQEFETFKQALHIRSGLTGRPAIIRKRKMVPRKMLSSSSRFLRVARRRAPRRGGRGGPPKPRGPGAPGAA
jgi:hypothetical protein